MEVGVSQGCVEAVKGVVGIGREVEQALEHEVDVGVVADDAAVESVVRIFARSVYVGIVVAQQVETVDPEGIYAHGRSALAESGVDGGAEGDLADEILTDEASHVDVVRHQVAVDPHGRAGDYVADIEVCPGRSGRGVDGAVDLEVGEASGCAAVETEGLAPGKIAEVDGFSGDPLAQETSQPFGGEGEVLELGVEAHIGYVGDIGQGYIGGPAESGSPVLEVKVVDAEIVDRTGHPAGIDIGDYGVVLERRDEIRQGLETQRAATQFSVDTDLVYEVREIFRAVVRERKLGERKIGRSVAQAESGDGRPAVAHAGFSAERRIQAALFPDPDALRVAGHHSVRELEVLALDVGR